MSKDPHNQDHQAFVYSDKDTQLYAAGRISETGTRRIKGRRIWMETSVQIDASAGDVVAALMGDWRSWWRHGVVETAPVPTDLPATLPHSDVPGGGPSGEARGSTPIDGVPFTPATTFGFKPVGYLIKVLLTMAHPVWSSPDGVDTCRIPVDLRGHFAGPGEMIVTARPDGGAVLVSRWIGVRNATILPTRLVAKLHYKAEEGTSPFQRHTGYVGLIGFLERHDSLASLPPQTPR
jgi:hypothetical protein